MNKIRLATYTLFPLPWFLLHRGFGKRSWEHSPKTLFANFWFGWHSVRYPQRFLPRFFLPRELAEQLLSQFMRTLYFPNKYAFSPHEQISNYVLYLNLSNNSCPYYSTLSCVLFLSHPVPSLFYYWKTLLLYM